MDEVSANIAALLVTAAASENMPNVLSRERVQLQKHICDIST